MTNVPSHLVYAPVGVDDSRSGREAGDTNKDMTLAGRAILPVLAVPTEDLHSPYSKLFQCSVVAEKNKYIMYYQQPDGTEIAVLRADKQKTMRVLPKFHIFDISQVEGGSVVPLEKANTEYLGKFRREKDLRIHSFELHSEREEILSRKVMHVLYSVPSLATSLFGKDTPRKAQVALYHEASDSSERGNTLSDRVASSMKETNFLDRVADPDGGLFTFSNKEPYKKANGDFALNFYSRCRLSNPGNMQMEDDQGVVILQLAQYDENRFCIDFRSPFTAFQAFGFAIAQLCDY